MGVIAKAIVLSILLAGLCHAQEQEDGDYIVTASVTGNDAAAESVKAQISQLLETELIRGISIGRLRFLRVKTVDENALSILKDIHGVLRVGRNVVVRAYPVASTRRGTQLLGDGAGLANVTEGCNSLQNTTTYDLWGLSRTSRRNLDSDRDPADPPPNIYQYSEEDDGSGVEVYVMDTGINTEHVDFQGRASHGFTASSLSSQGDDDDNGHGTHVAGTVAGATVGIAKLSSVIAVKVLGRLGLGRLDDILEGLAYVHDKFKSGNRPKMVVNMSLGSSKNSDIDDAVKELAKDGITIVAAAGNDGADACGDSPGNLNEVITVGSTVRDDTLSSFSNYGSCVDILAPGSHIVSLSNTDNAGIMVMDGTSMAAPNVAGVIARGIQSNNEAPSPAAIKAWLRNSATQNQINPGSGTPDLLLYKDCGPNEISAGSHFGTPLVLIVAHTVLMLLM